MVGLSAVARIGGDSSFQERETTGRAGGATARLPAAGRIQAARAGGDRRRSGSFWTHFHQPFSPGRYTATISVAYTGANTARDELFVVSSGEVRQTYGTSTPGGVTGARGSSSRSPWLIGIGGLAHVALGIAVSSLYYRKGASRS